MIPTHCSRAALALFPLLATASPALAQTFDFVLDGTSAASTDFGFSAFLPGQIQGDFDATLNPTGTRTLPGLFGGSGNQPVPLDVTGDGMFASATTPTGSFRLGVDRSALSVTIDDLALEPLGGTDALLDLVVTLVFDTFRTFSPDSLYFGGIPLPIPVGTWTVSAVMFDQTGGPAPGVLVPDAATPGVYDLALAVPVDMSFTIDVAGAVTPVGPLPIVLPIAGTLDLTGGAPVIAFDIQQSLQQSIPDPLGGAALPDVPLPLPTLLPPGQVANVIYSGLLDNVDLDVTLDFALTATGLPACDAVVYCTSNPNSTGLASDIAMTGSTSVAAADFGLSASNLSPSVFGIFFYGDSQANDPFGAGVRCVGGQTIRLPLQSTTSAGEATQAVDPSSPANPAGQIEAGDTWNFQFWHRDQVPGTAGFNTSAGLAVTFCP